MNDWKDAMVVKITEEEILRRCCRLGCGQFSY